jgi:hypothetical protein
VEKLILIAANSAVRLMVGDGSLIKAVKMEVKLDNVQFRAILFVKITEDNFVDWVFQENRSAAHKTDVTFQLPKEAKFVMIFL